MISDVATPPAPNLILHFPPQRRYRDRDHGRDRNSYRRRDRSLDRRDEDTYRPSRRDRSRERRRSRDRDNGRDYRRRSRDKDFRARRDDSRDRDRRRPDDSADLKLKSRRDDSRDRGSSRRSRSRTREVSFQPEARIMTEAHTNYFRHPNQRPLHRPLKQTKRNEPRDLRNWKHGNKNKPSSANESKRNKRQGARAIFWRQLIASQGYRLLWAHLRLPLPRLIRPPRLHTLESLIPRSLRRMPHRRMAHPPSLEPTLQFRRPLTPTPSPQEYQQPRRQLL